MSNLRQKLWHGLRTRRVQATAEPDDAPRWVELPAAWDDQAAIALAAVVPGGRPIALRDAAEVWLSRVPSELADAARGWLLARRAAPDAAVWAGGSGGVALNLAAFHEPGLGLDAAALRQTASQAVTLQRAWADPLARAAAPILWVTDLDGLLAASGLEYGSAAGRDLAVEVMTLLRDAASSARLVGEGGLVDGLLGVEAGGVAPRFDWLNEAGQLSRGARAFLAAGSLSADAALAATLAGRPPLRLASAADHAAMRAAVAPFLELPELVTAAAASTRREPPSRPGGYARRVTLGGHRLFVRTAEFADGSLAELSLGLPKETAAVRALADSVSQLASLALQHGTPLADIVELLAGTRFGPAGPVDGDPNVAAASSPLDYLARSLAAAYLPQLALDPVAVEEAAPLLPLDMPQLARPKLRVVR